MVKLQRHYCGDYFTTYNGNTFWIEKGCIGWNISIMVVHYSIDGDSWNTFDYITSCDTLKMCRETIETYS